MKGTIIIEDPNPPKNILEYIRRFDYSLWAWASEILILVTLISIVFSNRVDQLTTIRYIFGHIFILFLPGYLTIEALYPRSNNLTNIEKLSFSITFSVILVTVIGLVLNYSHLGLRLLPLTVTLFIYSNIVLIITIFRKYNTLKNTNF